MTTSQYTDMQFPALAAAAFVWSVCHTCPSPPFAVQIAEEAMAAFESDSPLGSAALELLPKALALLQAGAGCSGCWVLLPNAAAWRRCHICT